MNLERHSTHTYSWRRAKAVLSAGSWRKNPGLLDGFVSAVPLQRAEGYNVMEARRQARSRRDPLLAPHGFFRILPHGRNSAAVEFVEKFGPLEWPQAVDEQPQLVFHRFWLKHLRYVGVLRLWEQRDSESGLRQAFSDLHTDLHDIDRAEDTPDNPDPLDPGAIPLFRLLAHEPHEDNLRPWEHESRGFDDWLAATSFNRLRETAIKIFHSELNLHITDRTPRWFRLDIDSEEPVSFQLFLSGGTLWQYIWELTGLETTQVAFWRLCPSCNTIFYPKRSDQLYCTSKEQVLVSKRNYARARRERERLQRLLAVTTWPLGSPTR